MQRHMMHRGNALGSLFPHGHIRYPVAIPLDDGGKRWELNGGRHQGRDRLGDGADRSNGDRGKAGPSRDRGSSGSSTLFSEGGLWSVEGIHTYTVGVMVATVRVTAGIWMKLLQKGLASARKDDKARFQAS